MNMNMNMNTMMMRFFVVTAAVAAAACGGPYIYTPGLENPPITLYSLHIDGSGFDAHDGEIMLVRIKAGPTLLWCGESSVVDGGRFSVDALDTLPEAEIIGSRDGNDTYDYDVDEPYQVLFEEGVAGDVDLAVTPQLDEPIRGWPDGEPACGRFGE